MPLQLLFCLFAGALIAPSLAPFNIPYLVLLPPAILYLCSCNASTKNAAWLGWFFGLGFFGSGVSWVYVSISEHSATPAPAAVALTILFVAGLAILFALQSYIWRKFFSARWIALSFAAIWVLFEWLRSWLFTGFPWLYLGNAALDTPLQNLIPVGGVWLASLSIAIIAVCSAEFLRQRTLLPILFLPLPLIGSYLLPTEWTTSKQEPLGIAIVQPNIPQSIKWEPEQRQKILEKYITLSSKHLDTELLLWPETAIPALFRNVAAPLGKDLDIIDSNKVTLISGMPSIVPDQQHPKGYRVHNSLAVLTTGSGIYHKQRLVPFGEYLPMEALLRGALDFFNLPMSSFSIPKKEQPLLYLGSHTLAPAICYEIAYPELVRRSATKADLILTVSNDTWFGDSIAPAQHLQIAQVRALENGRWVIRGTNNGITALINHRGEIISQLPQFQEGVLRGQAEAMEGLTPFQIYGSLPVILGCFLLVVIGLGARKYQDKNPYPDY
ncbi:MAG: apolipoprotein N-acyltransferase [Neptuniibacter sp.]